MKETTVDDLSKLPPGSSVETTFLVQSKERRTTNVGKPYLDLTLQDSTGQVRAKIWDLDRVRLDFEEDDIVRVNAVVEEYQGARQLKVKSVSRAGESLPLRDYVPHSAEDPAVLLAAVVERARRVSSCPLRQLLLAVLEDPVIAEKYQQAPAATSLHHAYLGGLVEHVRSLLFLGDRVSDHYPALDRDLVIAGLILHDVGKIEELTFERGLRYTTRGKLLGHITLGLALVRDKATQIQGFPPELWDRLEHIILSHHGKLEFGSPKEPAFPEALVVHYLDDMDSKVASMTAQYAAESTQEGDWTSRNRALGRELLKPSAQVKNDSNAAPNSPDAP
jgi:3'-5' exoribonuclease